MLLNLNIIITLAIISIFFYDCRLQLGSQAIAVFAIFTILTLIVLFLIKPQHTYNIIKKAINLTPIKYLCIFLVWLIIDIFLTCHSISSILHSIIRLIIVYGTIIFPVTLLPLMINPQYISYKKLYKYFLYIYVFILGYGFFNYIGRVFDVKFIQYIHYVVCSKAYFYSQASEVTTNLTSGNRATSIFFEPSFYALFIFVFLPFVFNICFSNIKINRYKTLNKLIKAIILITTFISLLLTQSPVYIVLSLIYTLIYFTKKILKTNKRTISFLFLCCLTVIITINFIRNNDIESNNNGFIKRIEYVLKADNLDLLIMTEKSLGTRICTFINAALVTKRVPIFGTGYANSTELMRSQMNKSPIVLTEEVQRLILNPKSDIGVLSIFLSTWLQTGIIGLIILYMYFIKTIIDIFKYIKYDIYNKIYILSFVLIGINFIVNSFYFAIEQDPMMWFIFGILNSYILTYKRIIKNKNLIVEEQNNAKTIL